VFTLAHIFKNTKISHQAALEAEGKDLPEDMLSVFNEIMRQVFH